MSVIVPDAATVDTESDVLVTDVSEEPTDGSAHTQEQENSHEQSEDVLEVVGESAEVESEGDIIGEDSDGEIVPDAGGEVIAPEGSDEVIKEDDEQVVLSAQGSDAWLGVKSYTVGGTMSGYLDEGGEVIYTFYMAKAGCVHLSLDYGFEWGQLELFDESRKSLDRYNYVTETNGRNHKEVDWHLSRGQYYLRLNNTYFSEYGSYSFRMTSTSADEDFPESQYGSDNTTSQANEIKLGTWYKGMVSLTDDDDYYRFTAPSSHKVRIQLSQPSQDRFFTVTLYDGAGNKLWRDTARYSDETGNLNYSKVVEDGKLSGTCYVCVSEWNTSNRLNNAGMYKLRVSNAATTAKKDNVMKVTTQQQDVSYDALKQRDGYATPITVTNNKGKVTYTREANGSDSCLTIADSSTGQVKVAKGTKPGSYKIKVKVHDPGNATYKPGDKTVIANVRVMADNPIVVKASTKYVKYATVKSKSVTVAPITVTKALNPNEVSYSSGSLPSCLKLNEKTGKITVKKGTKKGTYEATVMVMASGDATHFLGIRYATFKVIVSSPTKDNPTTLTCSKKTVKYAVVKTEDVVVKPFVVSNKKGTLTYTRVASASHSALLLNSKNGHVTVKKGTKVGTYKMKVHVVSAGNATYKTKSWDKTVKVQVTGRQDEKEPNYSKDKANTWVYGNTLYGRVKDSWDLGGDEDYFKVNVPKDGWYRLSFTIDGNAKGLTAHCWIPGDATIDGKFKGTFTQDYYLTAGKHVVNIYLTEAGTVTYHLNLRKIS